MADKPFDPTKPVQTRDGRKARILATDVKSFSGRSIVIAVTCPSTEQESVFSRYSDGRISYFKGETAVGDLVNVPEVTTSISNVYRDSLGRIWSDYFDEGRRFGDIVTYFGFIEWTLEDGEPVSCRFVPDKQGAQ